MKDKSLWLTPRNIWRGLVDAIYGWRIIAVVTASVGMLLGTLTLSGLGIKISRFVIDVSGEQLLIALALVGLASLILGMGLDITPLYLTLVVLTAPALIELGLTPPSKRTST
ncbi:MAG: TRAP transporter large permease subunit [Actinophytocola sp.]|nr:TRAP transporter large permease subunit [Actinophytocola sp.]